MIYWTQFDWPSFATLATGLAAVIGAVVIGLRQMRITERQNLVAEMALKAELFDRRLAVYAATNNFLRATIDETLDDEISFRERFQQQSAMARFLFRDEIYDHIREISQKTSLYRALVWKSKSSLTTLETAKIDELMVWMLAANETLHEKFYPEMKLNYNLHVTQSWK
jgi:hypothetical protein